MSGTDTTKEPIQALGGGGGPAIILVEPQLAENMGTAARAMYNCGLTDMRLVKPKQDWLSAKALAASSGASEVLKSAGFYESTEDALADRQFVAATTKTAASRR